MTQLKRTQSAKELISDALCNLIEQKKKYQDISISDITKEAGVCRNSFYRNFNSKDDILKENFSNIAKQSDDLFIKSKTKTNYDLVYSITVVWKWYVSSRSLSVRVTTPFTPSLMEGSLNFA